MPSPGTPDSLPRRNVPSSWPPWRNFSLIEARSLVDDPGNAARRAGLSNAEYNYTIRDLIGSRYPTLTASFPIDLVSGEGFSNTSEVLVVAEPFQEARRSGRLVADHVSLTTHRL